MTQGLPVSNLINVQVNLSPQAAAAPNFNSLLIVGESDVINVEERIRSYGDLDEVAADFGTEAPEYEAAALFFGQVPQPAQLYIGRWAESATNGLLVGGVLPASEQDISNWTSITDGAFTVSIDGTPHALIGLDFSDQTNLNGVADIISDGFESAALTVVVAGAGGGPGASYAPGDTIIGAGGTADIPVEVTVTHTTVVNATIATPGSGGVNGTANVTGTTGNGTKFIANVTITTGAISAVNSITTAGDYTVNPTDITQEPVTGGSLVGAKLNVQMGVLNATITQPGAYSATPTNPVSQDSSSGDGTGATFNFTWSDPATASCTWNGEQFQIASGSAGSSSSVGYATSPGSGTDLSAQLHFTLASGALSVPGISAETALQAVTILDAQAVSWYLLTFAAPDLTNDGAVSVAGYVEGSGNPHLFGAVETNSDALDANTTSDLGSRLKAAGYNRSFAQYSENPYAASSFMGRAVTVNFAGSNTTLTMMYKGEPGVIPEGLTTAQANVLKTKRYDVFVNYNNATSIIQYGTMAGPVYFDEMQDLDWLRAQVQTNIFDLLFGANKVPQTDAGNQLIASVIEAACDQAVTNGTLAPGTWNAPGFGQLAQGQFLPKGYYVYTPPIATQSQGDREARESVLFQVAAKLAGAIQTVDVLINVNR